MEDEEKMHRKNGNDLKNSKSLMRKGKEMNMKNDKVDRGREMGLNREKRCREQSLHFSVRMVWFSFLVTRGNICKRNKDTSIFLWHFWILILPLC